MQRASSRLKEAAICLTFKRNADRTAVRVACARVHLEVDLIRNVSNEEIGRAGCADDGWRHRRDMDPH